MKYFFTITLLLYISLLHAQFEGPNFLTYDITHNNFEVADFDNDGDLDVVFPAYGDSRPLVWFENDQNVNWIPHALEVPEEVVYLSEIVVADVNNDNLIDLVFSNNSTYLNTGTATSPEFSFTENGLGSNNRIVLGDVNNDGNLDALTWDYWFPIKLHLNTTGDGNFDLETTFDFSYIELFLDPVFAGLKDLDGDGDLDIFAILQNSDEDDPHSKLVWLENMNGEGDFAEAVVIDEVDVPFNTTQYSFELNDFNGDGLVDIVYGEELSMGIYVQQSDHTWVYQEIDQNLYGKEIRSADFDNDGDIDFVTIHDGSSGDDHIYLFENTDNNGSFELIDYGNIDIRIINKLNVGDFNNDGLVDIFFSNAVQGGGVNGVYVLINENGDTPFTSYQTITDNINNPQPTVNDLDGDGDNDILLFSLPDQEVHWLENENGLDSFSAAIPILIGEELNEVFFEDMNNDGNLDIVGLNVSKELCWFEKINNNPPTYAEKDVIRESIRYPIVLGDIDADGDIDIIARTWFSDSLTIHENLGSNEYQSQTVFKYNDKTLVAIKDVDADGLPDVIYTEWEDDQNKIRYFKQDIDGNFLPVEIMDFALGYVADVDIDGDGDIDIIAKDYQNGTSFFKLALQNNGTFETYNITSDLGDGFTDNINIVDLDNDGKKDIVYGNGWFRQLSDATNFSNYLSLVDLISGEVAVDDLDGDGYKELIGLTVGGDALAYWTNKLGEGYFIEGKIAIDQDDDCTLTEIDTFSLSNWLVDFQLNDLSIVANSNALGYYTAFLPDSGSYVSNITIPNTYWGQCFVDSMVTTVSVDTTLILDFPVQAIHDCPLMQLDISSTNLRPCIDGKIAVQYCNEGTVTAENVMVEVVLDSFLINDNSLVTWTSQTDTSYIFSAGDMAVNECATFYLFVTPDCEYYEESDIVCATAYVTPDSLCAPLSPAWDGSTIVVNGVCMDDVINFEIKNIGEGDMDQFRQFRVEIINDDIVLLIDVDTFQLESEESKYYVINAPTDSWRLEADQDLNHPVEVSASAVVEDCGGLQMVLNLFSSNDGNPFSEHFCLPLTGSYDPNAKAAIPIGVGEEHFIDRDWELDYTIHFQNTGSDTAFTVVLRDTISEFLDLTTLRMGAASHDYTWLLKEGNSLEITFDNILLPDSTTNELGSQGFVHFSITPKQNINFGTHIENEANIYFDFNEPILTNLVSHTIATPIFAESEHIEICMGDYFNDIEITADTLTVDSTMTMAGLFLYFNHIHALEAFTSVQDVMVEIGSTFNGISINQDTTVIQTLNNPDGCDSTYVFHISIITSTENLSVKKGIKVFPIPTNNLITIEWNTKDDEPNRLEILDVNGEIWQELSIETNVNNQMQLDVSQLKAGIYCLKMYKQNGYEMIKLVIL